MIQEYWQYIATALGLTSTGGVIGWYTNKKVQKSTEKSTEAGALLTTQQVYDKLTMHVKEEMLDIKKELNEVKEENRNQRQDLRALQKDNSALHVEVAQLTRENHELKRMVTELKAENIQLVKELEKYKKK